MTVDEEQSVAISKFRKERNEAFISLDLDWAKNLMLPNTCFSESFTGPFLLLGLHKARYECTDISAELRHKSGAWLRERGFGRMTGEPLLPKGELPQ